MDTRWELNKVNVGSEGSHILKPSTIPKIIIFSILAVTNRGHV